MSLGKRSRYPADFHRSYVLSICYLAPLHDTAMILLKVLTHKQLIMN